MTDHQPPDKPINAQLLVMIGQLTSAQQATTSQIALVVTHLGELKADMRTVNNSVIQQTELMRSVRAEVANVKAEVANLRSEMLTRFDATGSRFDTIDTSIERIERDMTVVRVDVLRVESSVLSAQQTALQAHQRFEDPDDTPGHKP